MPEIQPPDNYTISNYRLYDDRQLIGVSTGFQSFFNNPANNGVTRFMFGNEAFQGDVVRGTRPIAALVPRGITGKIIEEKEEKQGEFSSFSRTFPLARRIGNVSSDELIKRVAGETPYSPLSQQERARVLSSNMHISHIKAHMGLFELLTSLMILTGKMPAILNTNDENLIYDYRRNPDHIHTVAEFWNTGNADILGDLDILSEFVHINGKLMPMMTVLGEDAMDAYLNDDKVKAYHDNRRMDLGMVSEKVVLPPELLHFVGDGRFQLRGQVITPKGYKLYLFSYNQVYDDPDTGDPTKYMPKDNVLVASPKARCDRFFGPGQRLPDHRGRQMWMEDTFGFTSESMMLPENTPTDNQLITPEMFHFFAYPNENETSYRMITETAPVFGTAGTDGFATGMALIDYS